MIEHKLIARKLRNLNETLLVGHLFNAPKLWSCRDRYSCDEYDQKRIDHQAWVCTAQILTPHISRQHFYKPLYFLNQKVTFHIRIYNCVFSIKSLSERKDGNREYAQWLEAIKLIKKVKRFLEFHLYYCKHNVLLINQKFLIPPNPNWQVRKAMHN